jgi:hypothetical protein
VKTILTIFAAGLISVSSHASFAGSLWQAAVRGMEESNSKCTDGECAYAIGAIVADYFGIGCCGELATGQKYMGEYIRNRDPGFEPVEDGPSNEIGESGQAATKDINSPSFGDGAGGGGAHIFNFLTHGKPPSGALR